MSADPRQAQPADVDAVIAQVLEVDKASLDDSLAYQSIMEWDSVRHVQLMLALEEALKVQIDGKLRVRLSSVGAIRQFAGSLSDHKPAAPAPVQVPAAASSGPTIHRGLEGVYLDRTRISRIDPEANALEYRGYAIAELVDHSTFEDVAYLLIHGELPDRHQRSELKAELSASRARVPSPALELMRHLSGAHPMEALRSGISVLGALDPESADHSPAATLRKGYRLISQIPILIAAHHAARSGRALPQGAPEQSHAANLLHLILGEPPSALQEDLVNRVLIVHADHSSNASTTAARVAIGSRSGIHAAVTAAISTFAGELHGGAAEGVIKVVDEIGSPERAGAYVRARMDAKLPVMGFGHRVYRGDDPRVAPLREASLRASRARGELRSFEIVEALAQEMKAYARHGLGPNVDLYVGVLYRMLGIPDDLAVPMFVAGRIAGWVAQALEQQANNVLIRPLLHYVGPASRPHPRAGQHR